VVYRHESELEKDLSLGGSMLLPDDVEVAESTHKDLLTKITSSEEEEEKVRCLDTESSTYYKSVFMEKFGI
jgi:hypothetical protein